MKIARTCNRRNTKSYLHLKFSFFFFSSLKYEFPRSTNTCIFYITFINARFARTVSSKRWPDLAIAAVPECNHFIWRVIILRGLLAHYAIITEVRIRAAAHSAGMIIDRLVTICWWAIGDSAADNIVVYKRIE